MEVVFQKAAYQKVLQKVMTQIIQTQSDLNQTSQKVLNLQVIKAPVSLFFQIQPETVREGVYQKMEASLAKVNQQKGANLIPVYIKQIRSSRTGFCVSYIGMNRNLFIIFPKKNAFVVIFPHIYVY